MIFLDCLANKCVIPGVDESLKVLEYLQNNRARWLKQSLSELEWTLFHTILINDWMRSSLNLRSSSEHKAISSALYDYL